MNIHVHYIPLRKIKSIQLIKTCVNIVNDTKIKTIKGSIFLSFLDQQFVICLHVM